MLRRLSMLSVCVAVLLAASTGASAQTFLFANMTNSQEVPPANPTLQNGQPRPASFGTALLFLNADQTALTMEMSVFNIDFTGTQSADPNDNLTAAHIHASPTVTPTTTAGVVWGFIGTPFNDTMPTDTVVTPFATGVGANIVSKWDAPEGQNTTLAAQIDHLLTGRAYLNFHTTQFGGGEIRGAIVVPEPASLGALALAGVFALRRRVRA